MKQTHFFLGANSAEGFYGLYDQLLDARLYDLIILKGTPGCGKSTFMRRVAAALEKRGLETVYIHCSGDPGFTRRRNRSRHPAPPSSTAPRPTSSSRGTRWRMSAMWTCRSAATARRRRRSQTV